MDADAPRVPGCFPAALPPRTPSTRRLLSGSQPWARARPGQEAWRSRVLPRVARCPGSCAPAAPLTTDTGSGLPGACGSRRLWFPRGVSWAHTGTRLRTGPGRWWDPAPCALCERSLTASVAALGGRPQSPDPAQNPRLFQEHTAGQAGAAHRFDFGCFVAYLPAWYMYSLRIGVCAALRVAGSCS